MCTHTTGTNMLYTGHGRAEPVQTEQLQSMSAAFSIKFKALCQ